jgi:hypothetical protein
MHCVLQYDARNGGHSGILNDESMFDAHRRSVSV